MSGSNGAGRIHMLTDKQAAKLGKQNATMDEATEIAQRVAQQVTEFYMGQVPALVGTIVEAALAAYDKSVLERGQVTPQLAESEVSLPNHAEVSPKDEVPPVTSP